jgi:DmsE family decaheme c-type cytochrome
MSMRSLLPGGAAIFLLAALMSGPAFAQDPAPPAPPATSTQEAPAAAPQEAPAAEAQEAPAAAPQEVMACGDCHEQAKAFVSNPHARGLVVNGQVPNDVCSTCHGDGAEHIEGGGDKTKIEVPRGLRGANDTCLTCHDTATDRKTHRGGMHANSAAVNCFSCHSIHSKQTKLLAAPQVSVCSNCHATQVADFRNKPNTHRIGRGGMECSTCHEPHGRPGDSIRKTPAGEMACLACHSDKRGPFVFEHGGVALGGCTACHDPHGSTNGVQLKRATVAQLCLECHSAIGGDAAGSQPPSFHNLNSPRYRNCTSCHVAIHGSNRSPQLLK